MKYSDKKLSSPKNDASIFHQTDGRNIDEIAHKRPHMAPITRCWDPKIKVENCRQFSVSTSDLISSAVSLDLLKTVKSASKLNDTKLITYTK